MIAKREDAAEGNNSPAAVAEGRKFVITLYREHTAPGPGSVGGENLYFISLPRIMLLPPLPT